MYSRMFFSVRDHILNPGAYFTGDVVVIEDTVFTGVGPVVFPYNKSNLTTSTYAQCSIAIYAVNVSVTSGELGTLTFFIVYYLVAGL